MPKQISLEQALEWEVSKMGVILSTIHSIIPYFHTKWCKKISKQYIGYHDFKNTFNQEKALEEAKNILQQQK